TTGAGSAAVEAGALDWLVAGVSASFLQAARARASRQTAAVTRFMQRSLSKVRPWGFARDIIAQGVTPASRPRRPSEVMRAAPAGAFARRSPLRALRQQALQFRVGEVAPLARLEVAELDVADAHAQQLLDPETEVRGHQADLPIEALHQHDAETEAAELAGLARQRGLAVDRHTAAHAAQEFRGHLVVDRDQVFLLQLVLGAQDLVDDVAVAG
ncbi:hypothetical protein CATMIT_01657, partial [Catenibacterium mitsuokai DSM 15897]